MHTLAHGRSDSGSATVPTSRRPSFPGIALRTEGALLLAAAVIGYAHLGYGWGLFAALLFVPDVGMLGYLAGPVVGARTYNATHWLGGPALVGGVGLVTGTSLLGAIALIWVAHVALDRALGYGLKYATHFRDTHLQRVA